jgi:hypothetical protein
MQPMCTHTPSATRPAWLGLLAVWTWLLCCAPVLAATTAAANAVDAPTLHPAIPLLDESGQHVLASGKPYSPRMSCGNGGGSGCHDYDSISHAEHFEMGRDEADDAFGMKRGGFGHVSGPGYFGGFDCMGPHNLAKKSNNALDGLVGDFGAAGFVQQCSECHTGGGWSEKDRDGVRYDQRDPATVAFLDGDYWNRAPVGGFKVEYDDHYGEPTEVKLWDWKKSGVAENDCLMCHGDYGTLKVFPTSTLGDLSKVVTDNFSSRDLQATPAQPYEAWWQTRNVQFLHRGFFRELATTLLEFIDIKPGTKDGLNLVRFERDGASLTPKLDAQGKPTLHWNAKAFDAAGKVQIPMRKFPGNDNCWQCHGWWLEQDRRGFWGFGEQAQEVVGANGALRSNYKSDVHKGKTFVDDNGQSRVIDQCSACHTQGLYYQPAYANVDLDANHHFPKGHSDIDVRRDLDNRPGPKSCEFCHDQAQHKAIPSGQANLLDAHRERWKARGDLSGYPSETLTRITQTHLDVVACQTCHIKDLKMFDGSPMPVFYRYRQAEDGKLKIVPYNATYQFRYYWKDKNSGRALTRDELAAVYEKKYDAKKELVAAVLKDSVSGASYELPKTWSFYPFSNYGGNFKDSEVYGAVHELKRRYDAYLKARGYANADVQMVFIESNGYLVSHNTRPSVDSVPCEECHARKQNGAFSSLIADDGLLGSKNVQVLSTGFTLDKRLVDEGVVSLGMPYYQLNAENRVAVAMGDVLAASRLDPSMSVLKSESAKVAGGEWARTSLGEALNRMGVSDAQDRQALGQALGTPETLGFSLTAGDKALKAMSAAVAVNPITAELFPSYRLEAEVQPLSAEQASAAAMLGKPASGLYALRMAGPDRQPAASFFGQKVLVKLPYDGTQTQASQVKVAAYDGAAWQDTGIAPVLVRPATTNTSLGLDGLPAPSVPGYAVFAVEQPYAALALADAPAATNTPPTKTEPAAITPAEWASVRPDGACSSRKCLKAYAKARAKLKLKAKKAMKTQAHAEAAALKAARTDLKPRAKAEAEARATRKAAKAEQAQRDFEAAVQAVKNLHD